MSSDPQGASTSLLAVDTGGTFTDLVLLRGGSVETLKVPSTPSDPAQAVLDGIRTILREGEAFVLLHGSTVATNALLERRGARVALVTNAGFEDVIEIGRQDRPQLYALVGHRLPPLVAREDRFGIAGRLDERGRELEPLDADALPGLVRRIAESGVASVAVTLLHSYANPDHERSVAGALEQLGLPLSVSSALVPEFREYERTSTTVINAYVAPKMDHYLGRLEKEAAASRVSIMGSNGGSLPVARARREPVHTVLSGPAGGVVGALTWARRSGHDSIISFDMGGTSTDVSLCPGRPLRSREMSIAGQPAAIPVIDIHTVGAGGGSIARVDAGGALRVGPRSAGAEPGPICYGQGGEEVTVTDAHVWLGRLPAGAFLGGDRGLDRGAIETPLRAIADALGGSLESAAEGILAVADTAMERALRVISVERGYDPVDFSLVAFGGAGALHVAELTRRLGARRAIVPPDPGLLSAYGMLASPVTKEVSRTLLVATDSEGCDEAVEVGLAELEGEARAALEAEGIPATDVRTECRVDARYRGQSFELDVPADGWSDHFHSAHLERYGYQRPETPVEAVTVRVVATGPTSEPAVPELAEASAAPEGAPTELVYGGARMEAQRYWRRDLLAGHRIPGPAVIQEYSATTWLPPEWTATVHPTGSLLLTRDDVADG